MKERKTGNDGYAKPVSLVVWGTYDDNNVRIKVLMEALNKLPTLKVYMCHKNIWADFSNRSQTDFTSILAHILKSLIKYIYLLRKYVALPNHNYVLISYPGIFDLLILYPFAKIKGAKIYWDTFISIYDTLILDRKRFPRKSLIAKVIYCIEKLSFHLCDCIFMDTTAHADATAKLFHIRRRKFFPLFVGIDSEFIISAQKIKNLQKPSHRSNDEKVKILFYGTYIPLHGIEIIVKAIEMLHNSGYNLSVTLIGDGQEKNRIFWMIKKKCLHGIKFKTWVDYHNLPLQIYKHDICLGIFGKSRKSHLVVPNKIYQMLCLGKCIVTAKTRAIGELFSVFPRPESFYCVRTYSPENLAACISYIIDKRLFLLEPDPIIIDHNYIAAQLYDAFNLPGLQSY